jgi:hypothetical protein
MTAPVFTFEPLISFSASDPDTLVLSGTAGGDFTTLDVVTNDGTDTDLGSPQVANGEWTLNVNLKSLSADTGFF